MDPVNKMIPMSWDQRHTLNGTIGYNQKKFGATLSCYYNSGAPYTWAPLADSHLARVNLFPNNAHRPSGFTADLNGFYKIATIGSSQLRLNVLVYNLFDNLNDVWVNSTTGRAYTAIIRETDIAGHRSDFNDVYDSVHNPAMYNAPRLVKVGLAYQF